ncbi:MAG: gamma carbonic anhydrase family protein [Dehalococcoidia bacterium]
MSTYSFEGKTPVIHSGAYVHESAQVIGDVVIGDHCFVGAGAILRGDYGSIRIGDMTCVEEGCIIHAPPGETCRIGSNCMLGHGALIHCDEIGSYVRMGMGAIVSWHALIEDWVVIGDGAIVPPNQRLTSGHVYVGNPAHVVRALSEEDKRITPLGVKLYADLCDRYRAGLKRI